MIMQTDPTWLVLFLVCSLATWRLTHLMVAEDGPFDLICHLRRLLGDSQAGRAMDCFYCSSLWLAMPMALMITRSPLDWLFAWLSLSGAASLLERLTQRAQPRTDP